MISFFFLRFSSFGYSLAGNGLLTEGADHVVDQTPHHADPRLRTAPSCSPVPYAGARSRRRQGVGHLEPLSMYDTMLL